MCVAPESAIPVSWGFDWRDEELLSWGFNVRGRGLFSTNAYAYNKLFSTITLLFEL